MMEEASLLLQAHGVDLDQIKQKFWTSHRMVLPGKKVTSFLILYYLKFLNLSKKGF